MKCAEESCRKEVGGASGQQIVSMRVDDGDEGTGTAVEARATFCKEHGEKLLLHLMKCMGLQAQARAGGRG